MDEKEKPVEIRRDLHLGRTLGEGGMGEVFEGFESGLGSHAAVKILRKEFLDDREVRERFDAEARLMASIEHPGCLPIYGWGTNEGGCPFYAMKKVSGRTLTEVLEDRGDKIKSLVWRRRLLGIFQSACETVAYAHGQGIVHRDLKPDNVMIDDFGSVYVIDWGIAKRLGDGGESGTPRTLAGSVMGSPGYMSPEQADGQTAKAGPEADVFALGVILYEILTGRPPFAGKTQRESMAHTVNFDPKPPGWNLLVTRSLSRVCMKALHKDPKQRYHNARALADDIRAYNEGRRVGVIRPTLIERAVFWMRREPVRAALTWGASMAVLTALAFIGFQVWIDHRLADKNRKNVEVIDRDVAELDREIDQLTNQLTASSGAARELLENELEVLAARRIMRETQILNAIRSVKSLRFVRADPDLDEEGKRHLFSIFESGVDRRNALFLHALAESLLEEIAEGTATLDYGPDDIERLRSFRDQAEKASDL